MSDKKPVFIIENNDFAAKQLRMVLERYLDEGGIRVVDEGGLGEESTLLVLEKPYRVGVILDRFYALSNQSRIPALKDIGGGRFVDEHLGLYYAFEGGEAIRLTEKEIALIILLADYDGQAVSREQLLDEIWQYAEDVETHTLETHIYRLRQKIEEDPSDPKILQTHDAGYFLSIE